MRTCPAILSVVAMLAHVAHAAAGGPADLTADRFPVSITNPGAYRLAGNITVTDTSSHGIAVRCDGVAIDLGGFELSGPGDGTGCGIFQAEGLSKLVVSNGIVSNWRAASESSPTNAGYGLLLLGSRAELAGLTVTTCERGMKLGPLSTIVDCTAYSNRAHGFYFGHGAVARGCTAYGTAVGFECEEDSSLELCTAYGNPGPGFTADQGVDLSGCTAVQNGTGIRCGRDCDIVNSVANSNLGDGVVLGERCTVRESTANSNGRHGITMGSDCESDRNTAIENAANGIVASESGCKISGCKAMHNRIGIVVAQPGNTIAENVSGENLDANYSIADGNSVAPMVGDEQRVPGDDSAAVNVDLGLRPAAPK